MTTYLHEYQNVKIPITTDNQQEINFLAQTSHSSTGITLLGDMEDMTRKHAPGNWTEVRVYSSFMRVSQTSGKCRPDIN